MLIFTVLAAFLQTVRGAHVPTSSTKVRQNAVDTTTPRILVPLYVYPEAGAWDPLFTAIKNNPTAAFTVIINPNSGPGSGSAPESDYAAAIKQLRATPAAGQILEVVGYVRTGYGKRSSSAVKADVNKYVNWPLQVAVDGIFFDETSTQSKYLKLYTGYTDLVKNSKWAKDRVAAKSTSTAKVAAVAAAKNKKENKVKAEKAKAKKEKEHSKAKKSSKKASRAVTATSGSGITVLNPGTWPEASGFFNIATHIVVYEDKLSNFDYSEYQRMIAAGKAGTAFSRSFIFYNVDPNAATTKDGKTFTVDGLVKATVEGLHSTGGIFITDLDIASTDVYAHFSSIWQKFVTSVASLTK